MRFFSLALVLGMTSLGLLGVALPEMVAQSPREGGYGPPQANYIIIAPVTVHDNYFRPEVINVPAGVTVQWRNAGRRAHAVKSNRKRWDSGKLYPGEAYSYTFNRPGTYAYHCAIHGQRMRGVVVVKGDPRLQGSNKLPPSDRREGPSDEIEVSGPISKPPPRRGIIRLRLPHTWADVSIDGEKIDSMGRTRTFVTPELPRARTFEVTASWRRDGRTSRVSDEITVRSGQVRTLDFTTNR